MIDLSLRNVFLYKSQNSLIHYLNLINDVDNMNFIYLHKIQSELAGSLSSKFKKVHYVDADLLETVELNDFRLDFMLIETNTLDYTIRTLCDFETPVVYIIKVEDKEQAKGWSEVFESSLYFYEEKIDLSQVASNMGARVLAILNDMDDDSYLDRFKICELETNNESTIRSMITKMQRRQKIDKIKKRE